MQKYRYIHRKEMIMLLSEEILFLTAVLLVLLLAVRSSLRKRRDYKYRDETRKLELVLQPRETIKVICPQKKGRVILTSKRILFETKEGFNAVPIKTIKKVQGNNEKGNRTSAPKNMVSLTVTAEKEYVFQNTGSDFEILAKLLQEKVKKQRKKQDKRN